MAYQFIEEGFIDELSGVGVAVELLWPRHVHQEPGVIFKQKRFLWTIATLIAAVQ